MKHQSKLNTDQQQSQETGTEQRAEKKPSLEFATADELLRYDAGQTIVPAGIEHRLQKSAGDLPRPSKPSWWKRFFGGTP
jgi:hypothetical protein